MCNITDWDLKQFKTHYQDSTLTKEDIFHYTHAILFYNQYRYRRFRNVCLLDDFQQLVQYSKQFLELDRYLKYDINRRLEPWKQMCNITDVNLKNFQTHYKDSTITKKHIFHYYYTYNILYCFKNIPGSLRLPLFHDFQKWLQMGKQWMISQNNAETVEKHPLKQMYNITDFDLKQFQSHYHNSTISKEIVSIFIAHSV